MVDKLLNQNPDIVRNISDISANLKIEESYLLKPDKIREGEIDRKEKQKVEPDEFILAFKNFIDQQKKGIDLTSLFKNFISQPSAVLLLKKNGIDVDGENLHHQLELVLPSGKANAQLILAHRYRTLFLPEDTD